jgi:hypothetical protein
MLISRCARKIARDTTNYFGVRPSDRHTQLILQFLSKCHAAAPGPDNLLFDTIDPEMVGRKVTAAIGNRLQNALARTIHFILLSLIARTTPFSLQLSRCLLHPHRIVGSGATETALGKNITDLNRYSATRMCLALILAGGHNFLACFACHLKSPPSLRGSRKPDGIRSVFPINGSS